MFLTILILAGIGVLAVITFIVWLVQLSIQRGHAIEELQIRMSMRHDRIDYLSREIEILKDDIRAIEIKQHDKAKPRKR